MLLSFHSRGLRALFSSSLSKIASTSLHALIWALRLDNPIPHF
jgi:hypothetical protein